MPDFQSFEVFKSRLDNFYLKYVINHMEVTDFTKNLQHLADFVNKERLYKWI